jgi:hypothetical protein
MADTKTSALSAASAALAAMELHVNDAGTSKKITLQQLLDLNGDSVSNRSVAQQTIAAATTALVTGSTLTVPVGKLRAGTVLRWTLIVTKTAGTAANTFLVKIGTAGTTADATIHTLALPVGTGVADVAHIEIMVTIRTIGASATSSGALRMTHNLSATGFATIPAVAVISTGATFDSTVASLKANVTCTTAASTALVFEQCLAEADNL